MAQSPSDLISGVVRQVNQKGTGFKIQGSDNWINISKYGEHPVPVVGQTVRYALGGDGFTSHLEIVAGAPAPSGPAPYVENAAKGEQIARMAALKVAGNYISSLNLPPEKERDGGASILRLAHTFAGFILSGDLPKGLPAPRVNGHEPATQQPAAPSGAAPQNARVADTAPLSRDELLRRWARVWNRASKMAKTGELDPAPEALAVGVMDDAALAQAIRELEDRCDQAVPVTA